MGLVHCLTHPTTWSPRPYCYLEDLFVALSARGTDVGRQLIEAAKAESEARGAAHLYWHTQEFNGRARSLSPGRPADIVHRLPDVTPPPHCRHGHLECHVDHGAAPVGDRVDPVAPRRRATTSTSNFGVGRRESHVADAFYARFEAPEVNDDQDIELLGPLRDTCICGDGPINDDAPGQFGGARGHLTFPISAGKQYEEELDREGMPGPYLEYLQLLRVFAECKRLLEPGGRIAVNVANLGRKPYRSLAADIMSILQDDLRLLLGARSSGRRQGASGSCAWGSFRSPPILYSATSPSG